LAKKTAKGSSTTTRKKAVTKKKTTAVRKTVAKSTTKKKTTSAKKKKSKSSAKPKTTLTTEIAEQLKTFWMIGGPETLSDDEICDRIGITEGQLRGWLQRNAKALVAWNGKEIELGLRDLRTRARAQLKGGYLARLNRLATISEAEGDILTSAKIIMWLTEKQFPKDFGVLVGKVPDESDKGPKVVKSPFIPEQKK
jgi:hypothetical protein